MNVNSSKIVTPLVIINLWKMTLQVIINLWKIAPSVINNLKIIAPNRNDDPLKKCYKVMGNQCLLVSNGSPKTILVKFAHCSLSKFKMEIYKTIYTIPIRTWGRFLTIPKMAHHVKIDEIESFFNVHLIFSGNEFHMCPPSDLQLLLPNFTVFWEWTHTLFL